MPRDEWPWAIACLLLLVVVPVLVECLRGHPRRHHEPERPVLGDVRLWVRPHHVDGHEPRGRVDRWLATDGPTPTAGWWHNGGLILDDEGPALVDAAGLRHTLPATTAALVRLTAPRSVLLVDGRQALVARLPTTGFDERDLRRFAAAAGWLFVDDVSQGRTARHAVDLRSVVVDRAARGRRLPARARRRENR